jgi:hypothetical protein
MTIAAFDPRVPGRPQIRNPASPALRVQLRAIPRSAATAEYVEAIFLGCAVTAVASVLPLVMYLHR